MEFMKANRSVCYLCLSCSRTAILWSSTFHLYTGYPSVSHWHYLNAVLVATAVTLLHILNTQQHRMLLHTLMHRTAQYQSNPTQNAGVAEVGIPIPVLKDTCLKKNNKTVFCAHKIWQNTDFVSAIL